MSRIYLILNKYFEQHNIFNAMEFVKNSKINKMNFINFTTIPLYLHNSLFGADIENVNLKLNGNKYLIKKDSYEDEDNRLIIDLIRIKAKPDNNGDFDKNDNCAMLIIDNSNKSGAIQSLSNYTNCIKCIESKNPYKVGDVLIRILIIIAHRNKLKKLNLTDDSYLKCNDTKIPLIHLRTITKGEPFYCKYSFVANNKHDLEVYKHNKKIYLSKPMISKTRFMKYIMFRKFNKNNIEDQKIIKYINNILIPRLKDKNLISDLLNSMINDQQNESCYLLYQIYMKIFEYSKYLKYNNKSFDLDITKIKFH
jgi:hypothetical protein